MVIHQPDEIEVQGLRLSLLGVDDSGGGIPLHLPSNPPSSHTSFDGKSLDTTAA